MRRIRMVFIAALVLAGLSAAAPDSTVREIPFEIASNKPFVQVSINGSPKQWFILDTGCAGPSVIAKEYAERAGLHGGDEEQTHVGAGAGVQVGISKLPEATFEVGGAMMAAREVPVFPLAHVSRFEGRTVDGLLGEDFLSRHVVEIDYQRMRIRILDPARYAPPSGGIVVPITLEDLFAVAAGSITVPGRAPIPCRFVLDTGVRTTVVLYHPFSVAHRLLDVPGSLREATIGGGMGGESRGDIGRLATLRLGSFAFREPTAVFSRDTVGVFASQRQDGIIGGELLRRARVTFDYPHTRLILEPYKGSSPAFEYDMSGLFLVAQGDSFEHVVVFSVTRRTPAAEAGLQAGDEILSIDGRRSPDLTLEEARRVFRAPGTRKLEVGRNGQRLQLTLVARRLV